MPSGGPMGTLDQADIGLAASVATGKPPMCWSPRVAARANITRSRSEVQVCGKFAGDRDHVIRLISLFALSRAAQLNARRRRHPNNTLIARHPHARVASSPLPLPPPPPAAGSRLLVQTRALDPLAKLLGFEDAKELFEALAAEGGLVVPASTLHMHGEALAVADARVVHP